MPVVQHHVTRPDGTPAALLDVHIDLVTGDQRPVAFRRSDRTGLSTHVELAPGGDGWSANLVETSDIQPTGSVYRVTEHLDGAPRIVWHFTVPAAPGPLELVDLLVDPPKGPQAIVIGSAAAAIAEHNADVSAHPDLRALIAANAPGAATRLTGSPTAAAALSGQRIVTPGDDGRVNYASNTTLAHVHAPLWLTLGAANVDAVAAVLKAGEATEFSWNWTPGGPLFLGANGLLTQTPPARTAGALFSACVGVAVSSTSITLDRQPSVVLA